MNNYYPFVITPLPYAYDALEPYIDEETMHLHHDRHLQTYIDNLNHFLAENPALQKYSLEELLTVWRRLPCHLQAPLRNNAGGVYNHRFYFEIMKPCRSTACSRGNAAVPETGKGYEETICPYFSGRCAGRGGDPRAPENLCRRHARTYCRRHPLGRSEKSGHAAG